MIIKWECRNFTWPSFVQYGKLAEKGIQEVGGQMRVMKLAIEGYVQAEIPLDHPIMPWLVEAA